MREFINLHQVSFEKENLAVKKLFAIDTNLTVGIQQFSDFYGKNPKNPNQIEINNKPEIIENMYSEFAHPADAYETVKNYVIDELKLKKENLLENKAKNKEEQNKKLYFYVFERDLNEENPKLRGVFYATSHAGKPIFSVALTKSLEYEYEKEIYKKWIIPAS